MYKRLLIHYVQLMHHLLLRMISDSAPMRSLHDGHRHSRSRLDSLCAPHLAEGTSVGPDAEFGSHLNFPAVM